MKPTYRQWMTRNNRGAPVKNNPLQSIQIHTETSAINRNIETHNHTKHTKSKLAEIKSQIATCPTETATKKTPH